MSSDICLKYMMLIYADTDVCAYHLDQIDQTYTQNFEQFLTAAGLKIAVFHVPFPWEGGYGDAFVGKLNRAYDVCEHIIIICSELHNRTYQFIKDWDRPRVSFYICGYLNRRPEHTPVSQWMDWFITTTKFYKLEPDYLDALQPYTVKPKAFDALLGQPRSHRDIAYSLLQPYQKQLILTYMRDFNQGLYDHDFTATTFHERKPHEWLWDIHDSDIPTKPMNFTIESIELRGHKISLSQIVPVNIYNQTAYSVVTETNYMNSYTFYTEKTVKPILGRRLFVSFSGQHYLRNLHNLGFKTFGDIIDESYDEEPDVQRRYAMIAAQIKYLIDTPQEQILEQIQPIAEHNYQHMMSTDWYNIFSKNFLQSLQAVK